MPWLFNGRGPTPVSAESEDTPQRVDRRTRSRSSGSAFLTVGSAECCAQLMRLVRGIIVARVLGPDMMGIAFSMLIIVDFIERLFFMSPAITLVQDPYGGSRRFRHSLQLVLLIRGVFFAAVAIAFAWPIAWLSSLDEPMYLAGFFAVAIIPIFRNLMHVDVFRQLRNRDYRSIALLSVVPSFVSLVAAIPLSFVLQTFWLPLILYALNWAVCSVATVALAKRKFGVLFDKDHIIRIIKFVIPLVGAGIIVFFTLHGPRLLLQSAPRLFGEYRYTMADVGLFGIALTLCLLPSSIGSSVLATTWESQLARLKDNRTEFRKVFVEMQSIAYTMAAALMLLFGIGSTWILVLYDSSYATAGPVVTVLSVLGGLRLGRTAMKSAALSTGRSSIILLANLAGLTGLVATIIVVILGGSLVEIAICLVVGEIASFIVGNIPLMSGPLALRARDLWLRPIIFCAIGILGAYLERVFIPEMPLALMAITAVVLAGLLVLVTTVFVPQVRHFVLSLLPSKST